MIPRPLRVIGWVLSLVVIGIVVGTMVMVGSPMEARRQSADAQRASDLSSIAQMVRSYRVDHHKLPEKLTDCISYPNQNGFLSDPVTDKPYEYRVLPGEWFELCAVFETDTTKKPVVPYYSSGFAGEQERADRHPIGRICITYPGKSPAGG